MHPLSSPQFDVQVRVQRSFSFEELQSGAYFASLDESDLQFYRVYGQPVLIPPHDDPDGSFIVPPSDSPHSCGPLHFDYPVFSHKSYTLQNPLGEANPAPQTIWPSIKREPSEAYGRIPPRLYPVSDQEDASPSLRYPDDHKPLRPMYQDPPMDSLPYPPPAASASPPFFHSPSSQSSSPTFVHDHWEDAQARAQSYLLGELPSPVSTAFSHSLPQSYTPSPTARSHRSPSPRSPLRLSPPPHTKRSLDKKPALACLFCRGRKIACGPPQPGSKDKTCNQCARRHLKCEYPLESRRGMRKRRSLVPRTSSTTPDINPHAPRVNIVKAARKRSLDKSS